LQKPVVLLLIISLSSISIAHAQDNVHLDKAIEEIVGYLETRLPAKSVVAVLNVKSDNQALSSYIIGELVNTIIDRKNFSPIDREHIDFIRDELQFHLSGDVSDETAQAIGKILGAQTIISGEIIAINNKLLQTTIYRLEIKAISVETAAIQGTVNKNIQNDKKIKTITGGAKSFPISIGGGIRVGGSFSEGTWEETGKQTITIDQYVYTSNYEISETTGKSEFDIGGFIFFDLKYAQINVSMYNGSGKSQWSWNKDYYSNSKIIQAEKDNATGNFSVLLFDIGILAKYPFYLNNITLFPALGADYQLWVRYTENRKKTPGDLSANNALWLKVGGGIDYHITRSLFLRGEVLWGVKLPSKNERSDSFKYFTHSPSAYIGVGYVFNQK
jgi:hypothetical protein